MIMKEKLNFRLMALVTMVSFGWVGILNTGWLFDSYYTLVRDAIGLTDGQIGSIISIVGITSVIGYFFSGFFTDLLKPQLTMWLGIVCSIVGSFILYTTQQASYGLALLTCVIMLGGGVFFYCTAAFKLLADNSTPGTKGRVMGYFFAFQGIFMIICNTIVSSVINSNTAKDGLNLMLLFSCVQLVIAQVAIHFLDQSKTAAKAAKGEKKGGSGFNVAYLPKLLSNPCYLLFLVVAFCTIASGRMNTYTQPLLQDQFGVSTANVLLISTWVNNGTSLVMSILAGIIADKMGSARNAILLSIGFWAVALVLVFATPWNPSFLFMIVLALIFIRSINAICKPGRMTLIQECMIPDEYMGVAIGFFNVVGAAPDIFLGSLFGNILETYGSTRQAYMIIYGVFIVIALVAFLAIFFFKGTRKKYAAKLGVNE